MININETYEAWHFGNNEKNASELADLVVNNEKTSTASGLCLYGFENEELKNYWNTFDENMIIVCEEFEVVWR